MILKTLVTMAISAWLLAAAGAMAGDGIRDAGAKLRGEFGASASVASRSRTVFRAPRMIEQSQAVPDAVAQAPTGRRSFSVEPSQAPTVRSDDARSQVRTGEARRSYRSYSYDPGVRTSRPGARNRTQVPSYELLNTDPRKHAVR